MGLKRTGSRIRFDRRSKEDANEKLALLLSLLALGALGLIACGGGDDDETTAASETLIAHDPAPI